MDNSFLRSCFCFLSGTSIYLQSLRKNKKQLSLFLLKRGLWLILVELFVVTLAFTFDTGYSIFILQTIWSIGISMIILGLLIQLPFTAIMIVGLVIVLGHNSLDFAEVLHKGAFGFWWSLVHHQNMVPLWGSHSLFIFYPFLPWTGLMILGYCLGKIFNNSIDSTYRKKFLTTLGTSLIVIFIILRASNVYGDPSHWSTQKTLFYTFLSFINTTKYPPSLLYMCMTIGPAILFLAWFGNIRNWVSKIITVYGQVPFFYYVLHFYIIHTLCLILFLLRGHRYSEGLKTTSPFRFVNSGEGYSLLIVYIIWIGVVVVLYPLCKHFSNYKTTHKKWWLSYL